MGDLYSPVRLFYQNIRKGFCIVTNNDNNFNKTLISNFSITNSTEFQEAFETYSNQSTSNEKSLAYKSPTFSSNISPYFIKSFNRSLYTGYSTYEPLIIMSGSSYNFNYTTLNTAITNSYGKCDKNINPIRFLKNEKIICSNKITFDLFCSKYNYKNFGIYSNINLLTMNKILNTSVYIQPKIEIFKIRDSLYYEKIAFSQIDATNLNIYFNTYDNNICICANIATSIKHNFYVENSTIVAYNIQYFVEDIKRSCGSKWIAPLTQEVKFFDSKKV
jgi:hypothetical protein